MPLITVILPTRDRGGVLPRAVASVLAQTEPDWELLIIDNNRKEAPVAAGQFPGGGVADPRLQVLPAPQAKNAAAARNAGLATARGKWIAYLDDDDAYRPEKLRCQLALAERAASPLVLCGAEFHLRGRTRRAQCGTPEWRGEDLLLRARWNTSLLFHRHPGELRFDETLDAGEDGEFAHRFLAAAGASAVPVAALPLVDVYQDAAAALRTNLRGEAGWRAARRIWRQFGKKYPPSARRLFVLRACITRAKLRGDWRKVARLGTGLLCLGPEQWRFGLNALFLSLGWFPGRWVS